MKKTCNGCKAFQEGIYKQEPKCTLRYEIEANKKINDIVVSYKPKEECPKPKTMAELIYLKRYDVR